MISAMNHSNGAVRHWVTVRPDAAGGFTAQALGLPDVRATAATRQEALAKVQEDLRLLMASGELVSIDVPTEHPLLQRARRWDPNDPEMLAFMKIMDQQRQEDLENTLRELDQECSSSSSTPTT